ncbi:MAG: hypothetical protein KDB14_05320, partial [Planctomycetales bacterium]|nr:hypothetical protein [Planctomycetales bacterium]
MLRLTHALAAFALLTLAATASTAHAEEGRPQARVKTEKPRKVLIFALADGFRHSSIMTGAEA